jgi:hypothetical protein
MKLQAEPNGLHSDILVIDGGGPGVSAAITMLYRLGFSKLAESYLLFAPSLGYFKIRRCSNDLPPEN